MDTSNSIVNNTNINSPQSIPTNSGGVRGKYIAKYMAILSIVIVIIVSMFMILNYIQIKVHHPIESGTIDNLVKKLDGSDDDKVLREQIRVIDLMSRKAYFSYLWQLKTGAWIVIGFSLIFIFSVKIYTKKNTIGTVGNIKPDSFWEVKSKERKWMMISIGTLAIVAVVLSLSSNKYYTDFNSFIINENITEDLPLKQNELTVITSQVDTITTDSLSQSTDSTAATDFPTDAEIKRNHPAFRGPFGLGVNYKTKLPTDWDGVSGKNIKWKKAISLPGLNSPVIWGNFLFIAGANENTRKVFCYNRLTGALIWTKEIKNIPGSPAKSPKVTNDTGHSAASLTTDGKRVYAIFSNGDIVAFDYEGKQVWAKNLGVPDNHYGHSSSLQFFKNKLIVQYDDNKSCKLFALATQTGEEIWKTIRSGKISWASPLIVPKGNNAEIIVNNLPYVAAYNAETGKEIWKLDCLTGEIGSSPAYANGMVFAANEYAKMVGIKDGKIVWEGFDYLPDVSSPVAYLDYVFFTTSYGDLVCINQKDGALIWHHEFDNGFYGSPVIADGKLYCIDRTGTTVIVEAGKEFKLIGQPSIGEKSDCTPAFADGMIYIRGQKNLYCIGK